MIAKLEKTQRNEYQNKDQHRIPTWEWFRRRCRLKDFLSGALTVRFLVQQYHLCNFERGHHGEYSCEVIWNLDKTVQKEILFIDISYLELWHPFCSAECSHLCNFGRGYY